MKANKRIILMAALVVSSFVVNAQSEQWNAYLDIREQSRADISPCEKMDLFARIGSEPKVGDRQWSHPLPLVCRRLGRQRTSISVPPNRRLSTSAVAQHACRQQDRYAKK